MYSVRQLAVVITGLAAAGTLAAGCSNNSGTGASASSSTSAGATSSSAVGTPADSGQPGAAGAPGAPGSGAAPGSGSEQAAADSTKITTPSGDFVVQGAILQKYNAFGGANSPLGLPTSNEEPGPNGGQYSTFAGGAIYWTPETGAHVIWGGIRSSWEHDGGAGGPLGYPTSDEKTIPGGWESEFQHGTITYTDGPHIQTR
ncbi:MAG TPA: hypothetical protein VFB19_06965 [Mycobacterium sp.]|nr:hypothetical protein [Mycobacterium sp.]